MGVAVNSDYKKKLGTLRRGFGFAFLLAWIIGWPLFGGKAEWVAFALFTFPVPMIGGHYFAKYWIAREESTERQRDEQSTLKREAAEAAEKAQRAATMAQADRLTRIKNARKEVIDKLGVVSDYLDLLPSTTDGDRALLITQNIKNALRELVANYPMHDLAALIRGDESIQLQLQSLLPKLAGAGIDSDGTDVIREARHRALSARTAPPTGSGPVSAVGKTTPIEGEALRRGHS